MARADLAEQRHAFLARGGVGREVHVLDHQVDRLARQHGQAFLGRGRVQRRDVVQREQHVEATPTAALSSMIRTVGMPQA
jgi:hypothetical protein